MPLKTSKVIAAAAATAALATGGALGFSLSPASADTGYTLSRTTDIASVGGLGGGPYAPQSCAANSLAIGLGGATINTFMGRFTLRCQVVDIASGGAISYGAISSTPIVATAGPAYGADATSDCAAGSVMVGFEWWSTGGGSPVLSTIAPVCQTLSVSGGSPILSGPTVTAASVGQTQVVAGTAASCAPGEFMMGHEGREGWGLDLFTGYCGSYSTALLTPKFSFTDYAAAQTGWTLSWARAGGSTDLLADGIAAHIWPGTYSAAAVAPLETSAKSFTSTSSCADPLIVANGDDTSCTVTVTGNPDAAVSGAGLSIPAGGTGMFNVIAANYGPGSASPSVAFSLPTGLSINGSLPAGCSGTAPITCASGGLAGFDGGAGQAPSAMWTIPVLVSPDVAEGVMSVAANATQANDYNATNDSAAIMLTITAAAAATPTPDPATVPTTTVATVIVAAAEVSSRPADTTTTVAPAVTPTSVDSPSATSAPTTASPIPAAALPVASAAAPAAATVANLAFTGSDPMGILVAAGAFLLAGVFLLRRARHIGN